MIHNNANPARLALGALVFLGLFGGAALLDAGLLTAQTSKPEGPRGGGPGGEAPSGRPKEFAYAEYNALLGKYVSQDGLVDYAAWKKAGTADLDRVVAAMAAHPYSRVFSREARLAFLINAYNALTLQSILKAYPVGSVMDIEGFFDKRKHTLFDGAHTLDDIEKKLIKGTFSDVPQYHFGLVCGGKGCPPLRNEAYTGDQLVVQLDTNARAFVTNPAKGRYDGDNNVLHLSEIFRWYEDDFEAADLTLNRVVAPHFTLSEAMRIMKDEPAIEFIPFDWALNDAGAR